MSTKNYLNPQGKEAAGSHRWFRGQYSIKVGGPTGTAIEGGSPDGRYTGMCDRCGIDIRNVYVFADANDTSLMHVGIDCAGRMGVPVEELRKARYAVVERRTAAERAAARASAAERHAAEQRAREARLAESAELVADLNALAANPCATNWEREQITRAVGMIGSEGAAWLAEDHSDKDPQNTYRQLTENVEATRTRLALCVTSKEVTDKRVTLKLTAYRKSFAFDSTFNRHPVRTYISFLMDEAGNAYVYKGSAHCFGLGRKLTGTFTVDGADVRDGLTATRIVRPSKVVVEETAEERAHREAQEKWEKEQAAAVEAEIASW